MTAVHPTFAQFRPGSLVHARGRDWVVLPSGREDMLLLRPLTGNTNDTAGIFLPLEGSSVRPGSFCPPDPSCVGDTMGCSLLFDAARLSIRNGTAPFRSLGHISVVPRPYQLVPLIMALRLDPVRLLIADDVGVGKTIEAALIARELLDRGIARRLAVVCPSHLCDQWAAELREKFALDPKVVQPSQIARLQRELPRSDLSIYQYYPCLVASIDFVKSSGQRDHFLRNTPDLLIVDEAHVAARPRSDISSRLQHERHALVRDLASDPSRHLLLVTATPHSGIEESFRSLLGLLRSDFDQQERELDRADLLPYVVQRRRRDLQTWLGAITPFPERESVEHTYNLSKDYDELFQGVLNYCRETVRGRPGLRAHQQRVRHWAAIALLRCLLSSPGAAAAVLERKAERHAKLDDAAIDAEQIDQLYRPQVLDPVGEQGIVDYAPLAPVEEAEQLVGESERRRLRSFADRARLLKGPTLDRKLAKLGEIVADLLSQGFRPIVFCRFIPTAKYLEEQLPALLSGHHKDVRVVAVTGEIGDEERRARVEELAQSRLRVLVATDCLSEGINLQEHFDAVIHYDLPWNPNRLEQREGRVDRFDQRRSKVKAILLYGANNPVDLVVLDVLIKKARAIRESLGVAVPVPFETEQVVQALIDSVLLRGRTSQLLFAGGTAVQLQLDLQMAEVSRLHAQMDRSAEREREYRTYFAQHGISPNEVAHELKETDAVLGTADDVREFLRNASQRFNGRMSPADKDGVLILDPGTLAERLAERGLGRGSLRVTFDRLKDEEALYVGRTHPIVETFCEAVMGAAMASEPSELFARAGACFTGAVSLRTVVLLLRLRYLLQQATDKSFERDGEYAEEVLLAAFQRRDGRLVWIEPLESARELLSRAEASARDMPVAERREQVQWALSFLQQRGDWWQPLADQRRRRIEEANNRLRRLVQAEPLRVEPRVPPDILGCYVLVPSGGGRR